ncbi:iron chaperone [Cohnella sp. AR92]|uniref:iron chaperone n=1 Tax=Cohnella sp. AR92 TaxID=648716 RepID=UPI000F8F41CD|nr:DUF1801 domain-containing protein [Cohnella sp. AR92]RUS42450.1 DUF1801 domain-containing protein [Cohnella sp. AR92]
MDASKPEYASVDEYIAAYPAGVRESLQSLRRTILEAAPGTKEKISYQMPAYELQGMLVYFAGYKKHIGFYPGAGAVEAFQPELAGYKVSKGTIQFPVGEPLPYELIGRIVRFRIEENKERAQAKAKKKAAKKQAGRGE